MTPNAWVLFDKTEGKYLTTGSSPFYGHSTNVAEAHMYFKEDVAFRQGAILLKKFADSKKNWSKKGCELQVVPISVEVLKAQDVTIKTPARKAGFGVFVELQTGHMQNIYKGFWKRPPYSTKGSPELGSRSLVENGQRADVWKTEDAAAEWAGLMEDRVRDDYARSTHAKLVHFKVEVRPIK